MRQSLGLVALVGLLAGSAQAQDATLFPRPASLEPAIEFWTRVYTEVGTDGGFVHDSVHLDVVYETLHFSADPSSRERRRVTSRATDKYRDILRKLATGERGGLSTDEARVLALWPAGTSNAELGRAADRLRFQLGQANRFREGLVRSGRWKNHIYEILDARGLPRELAALPHVESSFDPTAYSKVGAAGMWQFTRSTGVRYMQIDHIIDERRDPFLSTAAAAQLLADNYSVIQSWPLALTAYNHGLGGMRRAVAQQGTNDIGAIVANYTSRTFGFASRNFYTAFLAALDVETNAEKYFGPVAIDAPEDHHLVALPDYMDAEPVARAFGLSRGELARLNPALMETVWAGDKFIPKGFPLRLPRQVADDPSTMLTAIPSSERYAQQRPDQYHRVRNGETLSGIAQTYRVSLASLVRVNNLSSRNFIRAGQTLTLPIAGNEAPASLLAAAGQTAVPDNGEYIVRRGDSIDRIARRFGMDEASLLAANDIRDRNRIYVGQTLRIAGGNDGQAPGEADVQVEGLLAANVVSDDELLDDGSSSDRPRPASDPAASVYSEVLTLGPEVPPVIAVALAEPARGALDRALTALDPATLEPPGLEPEITVDENEEPDLDSNVLASTQATLAADPSDYTVAENQTIEVNAEETLGHYADWLEIRTQRLRDLNGMPFREPVVIGQRIRLDFSRVEPAEFEQRRLAYQEQRQESFFRAYQIADINEHVIERGDSLWQLALRTYEVPVWLLRQYNPDLDLDRVSPGTVVKFPALVPVSGDAAAALPADTPLATTAGRAAEKTG
jgi:membrane-bound lytic murein transglycosylase D